MREIRALQAGGQAANLPFQFTNPTRFRASAKLKSVKDNRPINLDFTTLRIPLPAVTSFLHRVSGVFIFAGIALLLWLLAESLSSEEGFLQVQQWLDTLWVKLLLWSVVAGLLYHLIAGIKHLIMDMGIGETLEGGVLGAQLVIASSAIAIILAGVWLW